MYISESRLLGYLKHRYLNNRFWDHMSFEGHQLVRIHTFSHPIMYLACHKVTLLSIPAKKLLKTLLYQKGHDYS
jgi:hypothetical protein